MSTTTTTAQQIADLNATNASAARAEIAKGWVHSRWFGGCTVDFADGSQIVIRSGRIESPHPTPRTYAQIMEAA